MYRRLWRQLPLCYTFKCTIRQRLLVFMKQLNNLFDGTPKLSKSFINKKYYHEKTLHEKHHPHDGTTLSIKP